MARISLIDEKLDKQITVEILFCLMSSLENCLISTYLLWFSTRVQMENNWGDTPSATLNIFHQRDVYIYGPSYLVSFCAIVEVSNLNGRVWSVIKKIALPKLPWICHEKIKERSNFKFFYFIELDLINTWQNISYLVIDKYLLTPPSSSNNKYLPGLNIWPANLSFI